MLILADTEKRRLYTGVALAPRDVSLTRQCRATTINDQPEGVKRQFSVTVLAQLASRCF
ncbi:hypothetical protein [Pseudomonas sp. CFBP 13710]|uniref:hypothetical protein n=1 Tax=Pseudomonas sp. CFBP 13710 TaxID=2775311 RepID=UPI00177ADC73|nr:hypothetical protein [Pseudomonas sp. CFBP 13710]MBD8729978.1 hypothetical protein [Pseudomonas sp. CFBP 13710]